MALSYEEIFENNRKWTEERIKADPRFFEKLSMHQAPEYLFIGCSDSRADPEELLGLELGDIFVHRNVGNIVNPVDLNVATVIQYAVEELNVQHIIVCGHYGCGGVAAAMQHQGVGKHSPWLQTIRDIARIHREELSTLPNEESRYDRLVELNVIEQSLNVLKMDCVQERYLRHAPPLIHACVYDLRNGILTDLKVDYEKKLKEL